MPRGEKYDGPENFTAFSGEKTFLRIDSSAYPELMQLAKDFPKEFSSALKGLGWELRDVLKRELKSPGPIVRGWPQRSRMHMYRRMDLLKAGELTESGWRHGKVFRLKKKVGYRRVKGNERLMERWRVSSRTDFLRRREPAGGRLWNAIRYKMINPMRVDIGGVNPSAAKWLEALQAGKRGDPSSLSFTGSQPITPKIRRAFWAAGVPLAKGKTMLNQPERLLVSPVYKAFEPKIKGIMEEKVLYIMERNQKRGGLISTLRRIGDRQ